MHLLQMICYCLAMGVLFLHKKSVVLDLGDMNMASFNQEWGYVKYKKEKGS